MMGMAETYQSSTSVEYNNRFAEMKEIDLDYLLFLFCLKEDYRLTREWFEHNQNILLKSIFNVSDPFYKPKIVRFFMLCKLIKHIKLCIDTRSFGTDALR